MGRVRAGSPDYAKLIAPNRGFRFGSIRGTRNDANLDVVILCRSQVLNLDLSNINTKKKNFENFHYKIDSQLQSNKIYL